MKREEILSLIRDLCHSQGFYCRVYSTLMELKEYDYENYDNLMSNLEENIKEPLDLIFYFEC